jgi:hypothetical protein
LIYFLSRGQTQPTAESVSTATSSQETATLTDSSGTAAINHGGVPESIFLTHLESSTDFTANPVSDAKQLWSLSCGTDPVVSTQLRYTIDGRCVSSVELAFALPEAGETDSTSAIEQYLASTEEAAFVAQGDAVRLLLTDLLPAFDATDAVSLSTITLWAEEAVQIQDEDDDYSDEEGGITFIAYRTRREGIPFLICSVFMDS